MYCSRAVRRLPGGRLWAVRGQSAALYMGCSRTVHALSTGCHWAVRGLFACCPWTVRGYFFPCDAHDDWLNRLSVSCPRVVREVSAGCQSAGCPGLFACYPGAVFGLSMDCGLSMGFASSGMPIKAHQTDYRWAVRGRSGGCQRAVRGMSVVCPWSVRGLATGCPRSIHGLPASYPWAVHELSVSCP